MLTDIAKALLATSTNSGDEPGGNAEEDSRNWGLDMSEYFGEAVGLAARSFLEGFVIEISFPFLTTDIVSLLWALYLGWLGGLACPWL